MSGGVDEALRKLLGASESLDEDLGKLLRKCRPTDRRGLIGLALCGAAYEHAVSQRLLLEAGLTGTALALCRLHFEAVVRAVWTIQCANDAWLEDFTTPVEAAEHREPASQVAVGRMLDHIERDVPHVAEQFRLLASTIKAMHSFVHSGSLAVVHSLMPEYPQEKLIAMLMNRNLLHLYVANACIIAAQDPNLVPRMRLLREKHANCMPSLPSKL